MIDNSVIRNCTKPFPAIQGLINDQVLGKVLIKNIYQSWQGENIESVKKKHNNNPYTLRIGVPKTDKELKQDSLYFILNYLSYNPLTKDIEKREIVPYRNTEKVYIGQSIDEERYQDYKLYVDGKAVLDDITIKSMDYPISVLITNLINKVEKLQSEIVKLKRQSNNNTIYSSI